jgi:hypothetical protein
MTMAWFAERLPTSANVAAGMTGRRKPNSLVGGALWTGAFIIALVVPFVASGYHVLQITHVLCYAIALLGLNLLLGYNGQLSLGHGAFFALGAYVAILACRTGPSRPSSRVSAWRSVSRSACQRFGWMGTTWRLPPSRSLSPCRSC